MLRIITVFPRVMLVVGVMAVALPQTGRATIEPPDAPRMVQADDASHQRADAFLNRFGNWAFLIAPLFMIVVAILPIPAELPAMLNGMIFGPLVGTTITWLGAIVGAMVSFQLARRFGRPLSERFVKPAVMQKADRLVDSAGWPGLLVLRLIPTIAFTAINWGAGFTALSRWTFLWTTAVGILPGAIVFTASGSGVAVLLRAYPLAGWGLGALTLLVIWWTVMRYRRRPLRPWTGEFEAAP